MNVISIKGNIGRKVSTGYTKAGSPALWLDVASHIGQITDWVRVVFFDNDIEKFSELNCSKGDFIKIDGTLRTSNNNGKKSYYVAARDVSVIKRRLVQGNLFETL